MEITVDNRIILALAEIAGNDRDLDNIFVFGEEGESPVFFATDGHIALKVYPTQGDFNFEGNFVLQIPVLLKKVLKYNKKEENHVMNATIFSDDALVGAVATFYNERPFTLSFQQPEILKFEKMPDVWGVEVKEQGTIAFNPMLANKLGKALVKLGFPSMHTFLLGDHKMRGMKQNEEFIAEYILMGGRTDDE
jgi:hypothetical protein